MSGRHATLRWVLLAIAGLAIAVAVAVIASELTSQRIGLASEPLRAGEALAPANPQHDGDGNGPGSPAAEGPSSTTTEATTTSEQPSTVTAPTTTAPAAPTDDSGEPLEESDDD
jgi:hypothetical protein